MTTNTRKGIISLTVTDRGALYSAYMPFVTNGGVFVPTARNYEMGDEVFVLLKIMDDVSFTPVTGHVVWVTAAGAQGNKVPGIGIQFSDEDNGATKSGIEQHLAGTIQGERRTQTM